MRTRCCARSQPLNPQRTGTVDYVFVEACNVYISIRFPYVHMIHTDYAHENKFKNDFVRLLSRSIFACWKHCQALLRFLVWCHHYLVWCHLIYIAFCASSSILLWLCGCRCVKRGDILFHSNLMDWFFIPK